MLAEIESKFSKEDIEILKFLNVLIFYVDILTDVQGLWGLFLVKWLD